MIPRKRGKRADPEMACDRTRVADHAKCDSRQYFLAALDAFEHAAAVTGRLVDHSFILRGQTIRLRFAGTALIPHIVPALAHLASASAQAPDLTVCLWESATSGIGLPPPPWPLADKTSIGEIRDCNPKKRVHALYQPKDQALSMLDTEENLAVFWTASQITYHESSSPLHAILSWWTGREAQVVHAAAVGTARGGVLLTGKSGSGKSSTALACLDSSLLYAGDDYVLTTMDPMPYAHSLYNSAKVDPAFMRNFPCLIPQISNTDRLQEEKALVFLYDCLRDKVCKGFPIRAVLSPVITGCKETTLREISPAVSLSSLAPTTIMQIPGSGQEALQAMGRLVSRVHNYALEVGTDLSGIPAAVTDLLEKLS